MANRRVIRLSAEALLEYINRGIRDDHDWDFRELGYAVSTVIYDNDRAIVSIYLNTNDDQDHVIEGQRCNEYGTLYTLKKLYRGVS